jgi:hypothetical protein
MLFYGPEGYLEIGGVQIQHRKHLLLKNAEKLVQAWARDMSQKSSC